MHIHGTSHVHGAHGVNAPHNTYRSNASQNASANQAVDRLDISAAAEAASMANEVNGVRQDLVDNIRSQIAAGTYDTPAKMDAALSRLLDELA